MEGAVTSAISLGNLFGRGIILYGLYNLALDHRPTCVKIDPRFFPPPVIQMTTVSLYDRHELSRFLNERKANLGDGKIATMTNMDKNRGGKWVISDTDYPKFLDLMNDYLFVKRGKTIAFVEQPR